MAVDSSSKSAVSSTGDVDRPQIRRWSRLPSPWTQVVRGDDVNSVIVGIHASSSISLTATVESSSIVGIHASSSLSLTATVIMEKTFSSNDGSPETVSTESSMTQRDSSDRNNDNAAWNKPGVVESSSVMGGANCWPALSESTRPTPKSSSDASKPNYDGSDSTSQAPAAPLISETIQRQTNSSANANSTTNHGLPRQRSTRHRGSSGGSTSGASGGPAQIVYNRSPPPPPPLPPSFPAVELSPYSNFGNFVAPVMDTPVRGVRPMGGLGPQSGSDHSWQPQRSSSRRNGFGPRPRSDGHHYHNNNGGRRDSDHVPHQFISPGPYMPPPPPPPPNMRPFITPMSYDMASPYMLVPTLGPESFRGIPLRAQVPAAPMYFPTAGLHLPNMIVSQIDFYFSDANLVSDGYLKSNMDEEGWVPIDLIANFPRVQQLTTDIQLILESLRASMVVEVQGDKLRRRSDWNRWLQRNSRMSAANSGTQPPTIPSDDSLAASIKRMSLSVENSSPRGTVGSSEEIVADNLLPGESSSQLVVWIK